MNASAVPLSRIRRLHAGQLPASIPMAVERFQGMCDNDRQGASIAAACVGDVVT